LGKRVLIVDDAKFMRVMIRDILSGGGFEVVGEAEDGIEAIKLFKELHPDLVTMDITMPNMNGIDSLKEIRKLDENARVVMCTAMGQKAMVIESIQSGAIDFIVKPFQPERVLQTVTKAAGG
jgi:two-component system chemotaxis response regulator CheY